MSATVTRIAFTLVDSETRLAEPDCEPEVLCRIPGWALFRQSRYHAWEWIRVQ